MKKLLFILSTFAVFTILSCEKENTLNAVTAKWTMGDAGKVDTTITLKPQATGDMSFKMSQYSLCPTHIVGVLVKVNSTTVFNKNLSIKDTVAQKIPVKVNDNVTIQTKLIETGAFVLCVRLGATDCEIIE
jgi:hypothetical protein